MNTAEHHHEEDDTLIKRPSADGASVRVSQLTMNGRDPKLLLLADESRNGQIISPSTLSMRKGDLLSQYEYIDGEQPCLQLKEQAYLQTFIRPIRGTSKAAIYEVLLKKEGPVILSVNVEEADGKEMSDTKFFVPTTNGDHIRYSWNDVDPATAPAFSMTGFEKKDVVNDPNRGIGVKPMKK